MLNTGVVRRIDNLGRIMIPKELRNTFGLDAGQAVQIFTEGDKVIFKKYQFSCVFCGEASGNSMFKGKNVCEQCLHEMRE